MATAFTSQIASAKSLIAKYGQSVTWRQVTDGDPDDVAKPWEPGTEEVVDNTVDIAFFPEDLQGFRVQQRMRDDVVPEGLEVGYMAQQSFVPNIKDVVIRDGVQLRVWYIDPIHPDGTDILYSVGFRL